MLSTQIMLRTVNLKQCHELDLHWSCRLDATGSLRQSLGLPTSVKTIQATETLPNPSGFLRTDGESPRTNPIPYNPGVGDDHPASDRNNSQDLGNCSGTFAHLPLTSLAAIKQPVHPVAPA